MKAQESCGFGVQYSVNCLFKETENLEIAFKNKQANKHSSTSLFPFQGMDYTYFQ